MNFESRDETETAFGDVAPATRQPLTAVALPKVSVAPAVKPVAAPAPRAGVIASTTPLKAAPAATSAAAALAQLKATGLISPAALAAMAASKPAPSTQIASTAPLKASTGVQANTANFLDASATPLAPVAVLAPVKTAAQLAAETAAAKAHAAELVKLQAQATAQANLQHGLKLADDKARERATHEWLLANDPAYAALDKKMSAAGVDWGLLPAAGALVGAAAAVVVTGGAAAAALAVPVTASTAAGTVAAVGGAVVAADRLLAAAGGPDPQLAGQAKAVINTTQQLAAVGNLDAQAGLDALNQVAAERAKNLVPAGVPQALSDAGAKAFGAYQDVVATAPAVVKPPAVKLPAPAPQSSLRPLPTGSVRNPMAALPATSLLAAAQRPMSPAVLQGGSQTASPVAKWLVSDAGRIYSADQSASLRGVSGWVVFGDGKVVRAA